MKWTKKAIVLLLVICTVALAGCSASSLFGGDPTFAEWTKAEPFKEVPAMVYTGTHISDAENFGAKNYLLTVSGTSLNQYKEYLALLEKNGFTKYGDNGPDGIDGSVYTAYYTKGELVLTVSQMVNVHKTYITAKEGATLSPHIFEENPSTAVPAIDGMKTTVYNLQTDGNAFLIQLKNGHFIMNDGGSVEYLEKIVELMEELTPAGQKPTIDAWFFSHEHGDHAYLLKQFYKDMFMPDRVNVEAVYFSEINPDIAASVYGGSNDAGTISTYVAALRNSAGEIPTLYRPHAGDRYYFSDIVIEIPYTQEQTTLEEMEGDLNGTSLWMMYYIDGQKFLLNGDTERNNVNACDVLYGQEYFDVDIMAVFHHGHNIHAGTETYFKAEVLTYPSWGVYNTRWGPLAIHANNIMMDAAKEAVSYLDGGVKYTFPYEVGTYEVLENWYPEKTAEQNEQNGEYAAAKKEDRTYLETK